MMKPVTHYLLVENIPSWEHYFSLW